MPEHSFVHPTAQVEEPSEVGEGTKIWRFCHVMSGARIGKSCSLGQNVFVASGVRLGDHVRVQNNVSLYDGVELDDYVFCGPSSVFTNVTNPRAELNRKHEYRTTRVQRGATIGANATILCGITIGRYAFIGAGAVVTRDVPDYGLMLGTPAKLSGWMSRHGHRLERSDNGEFVCPESGFRYRETSPNILQCLTLGEDAPLT